MSPGEGAVFGIGLPHAGAVPGDVTGMGFKAFNLQRMAAAGMPVPQAFVLGTDWCRLHQRDPAAARQPLRVALVEWTRRLEQACGLSFGGERRPLLVSVRSGAPVSMPGMMDTVLNIGLCDRTVRGLLRSTGNPRLVWDSYRRLVQQYAQVVHGADGAAFDELAAAAVSSAGVAGARELDFESLVMLNAGSLERFADITGEPFPQDPREQLEAATVAVLDSWHSARAEEYRRLHAIDDAIGTAVTVQRMVFGNAGGTSGSGVGFTRDPSTGENRLYLDFLFNAQGEDVVSGRHAVTDTAALPVALPEVAQRLDELRHALETTFGDAQEFEFTVQDGRLYLLQSRAAKRTPWAALRMAVEQVREGLATPAQALARLDGIDLAAIERRRVADEGEAALAVAEPASIGLAVGAIALDAKACERLAARGRPAILVRSDTSTEDIAGIAIAAGVLTVRGGRTSHAAVVARQMGKVCLVGCATLRIDEKARAIVLGTRTLREGETICLDAERGRVLEGEPEVVVERPEGLLSEVARWRADA
ncbi:MAG TPA: PEP/pyruvate-binding domain-containing protein, partial [Usitatibacteraceae bacterium]|nr:PEP/pyruvate-binding domain-containing protein [Usitatibacteraceae bacterium]